MKIVLSIIWLFCISSCATLDECTYDAEGAKEAVCLSYIAGRPLMPRQAPLRSLDEYEINYIKYPTFSAATASCQRITGKADRACVDVNYTRMTATVHSVYSDSRAVEHELAHLTHPYDWETTYTPERETNWR